MKPRTTFKLAFIACLLSLVSACSTARKDHAAPETVPPAVARPEPHRNERGIASWYGRRFQGRRTASGERFDKNALTAAHRTLPFGTNVRVTNLKNGKSLVVRINDRGPYSRKKLIDLSYRAAKTLGFAAAGSAPVDLEVLGN